MDASDRIGIMALRPAISSLGASQLACDKHWGRSLHRPFPNPHHMSCRKWYAGPTVLSWDKSVDKACKVWGSAGTSRFFLFLSVKNNHWNRVLWQERGVFCPK